MPAPEKLLRNCQSAADLNLSFSIGYSAPKRARKTFKMEHCGRVARVPHLAGLVHARVGLAFSFERPSGRCGDDRVELFPLLQRCENGGCPILAGLVHARVGLAFSL